MPKKKRQPKPEQPKRPRGRPEGTGYHPTAEQRHLVKVMSGMGIPEDQMVAAIKNPLTKEPISPVTLRKHFREELDQGFVEANAKVGASFFFNDTATTEIKGVSTRYFWEPKVVDKALVPDRYKIVDLAMLKKIGTATKGEEVVAGVEWVKQAVQSVRS